MAEITPNLIHIFNKARQAPKPKPPFLFGLRTGYVRAWIFVVLKVWVILALVNGVTTLDRVEKNIALLDSYMRNDYSTQIYYDDNPPPVAVAFTNTHVHKIPRVAGDVTPANAIEPRGAPMQLSLTQH